MLARKGAALLLVAASAIGWAGCSDSSDDEDAEATLTEYKVTLSKADFKAGEVKLKVKNSGGTEHEFVIVRAADAAALPTAADGSVDEDKIPKADQMGEIEDIAVKTDKSKTFNLEPGDYVAFCNVVTDDEPPISHFDEGMSAKLSVSQ
jgi:uncharacterized cupredoxin-like copper-binding protein